MVFIENDRIIGWNCPPKEILVKLRKLTIQNQVDKYNRPNWRWPDYPEGEPLYSPQAYNLEQTERLRKEWCQAEIEKAYPQDIQMKILTESMVEPTEKFVTLQIERKRIIAESKTKNFQIEVKDGDR